MEPLEPCLIQTLPFLCHLPNTPLWALEQAHALEIRTAPRQAVLNLATRPSPVTDTSLLFG
jgi:hypothetical protein